MTRPAGPAAWTATFLLTALATLPSACGPEDDDTGDDDAADDDSAAVDDDSAADDDTTAVADDDTVELPATTLPFDLLLSGAANETVTFDSATCASYTGSNRLDVTWESSATSWNLRLFVRDDFTGEGAYTGHNWVQLLENFSGGRSFYAKTETGQAISVTIDGYGSNGVWGTFTTDPLEGSGGDVTIAPQPVAVWCDTMVGT